mgnify:CR=1 FL=1
MPLKKNIKRVMVIGSGPIVIGQAAEFDYAGTQACRALKEEGLEVILVNSNPATIMTDNAMADKIYIEPLKPCLLRLGNGANRLHWIVNPSKLCELIRMKALYTQ